MQKRPILAALLAGILYLVFIVTLAVFDRLREADLERELASEKDAPITGDDTAPNQNHKTDK